MATTASNFTIEIPPEVKFDPQIDVQLATLDSQALTQSEQIRAMAITDQDTYQAAVAQGRLIATFIGEVESCRERLTSPLFVPLNRLRGAFKSVLDVAGADKQYLAGLCGRWDAEQRRLREEKDRRDRVEADRLAQEAKLAAAIKAEDAGLKPEAVEQILSSPVTAVAPYTPPPAKAQGVSGRQYWKFYPKNPDNLDADAAEAIAFRQLVVAAAEDPKLMCFLERNVSACNKEADMRKTTCNIPGYEALVEAKSSFRKY